MDRDAIKPGDLVRAVELTDHDRTRTYAEGILLRLHDTHYADGCFDLDLSGQLIVTLLDHSSGVVTFLCDRRRGEWLGSLWLETINKKD